MPRICAELVGYNCKVCIEAPSCMKTIEVEKAVVTKCGIEADVEALVTTAEGSILGKNTEICSDVDVKVLRLLRGGLG